MPLRTPLPKVREPRVTGRGPQIGRAEEGRVELPPAGRPGQVSNPLRQTDIRLSSTQNGAWGRDFPTPRPPAPSRGGGAMVLAAGIEPAVRAARRFYRPVSRRGTPRAWLPLEDSNLGFPGQSRACYLCTTGQDAEAGLEPA